MTATRSHTSNAARATTPSTSPATASTTIATAADAEAQAQTTAPHTKNVFRLHGVNVLNRKNVDSIARLTALERRRAAHILDERQRRDTMNQLLTELASIVQGSASEVLVGDASASAQQLPSSQPPTQQQQQQQQSTLSLSPPSLSSDGTEKRPPVKSNSITTLRNAIAEIKRLRAYANNQQQQQQQQQGSRQALTVTTTPVSSRRSSSRSISPSVSELASLSTLAELASQHRSESIVSGS
ncbi:hypothetical protein BGZ98_005177, partial [Dissophora globulifera]